MNPIKPINQWSCALAALSWNLHRLGKPLSQDELIDILLPHMPRWNRRLGLMNIGELLYVLPILQVYISEFILTKNFQEFVDFYSSRINAYRMGFVIVTIPTSHCMAIDNWDGSGVHLIDEGRSNSGTTYETWSHLTQTEGASFLALYQ